MLQGLSRSNVILPHSSVKSKPQSSGRITVFPELLRSSSISTLTFSSASNAVKLTGEHGRPIIYISGLILRGSKSSTSVSSGTNMYVV